MNPSIIFQIAFTLRLHKKFPLHFPMVSWIDSLFLSICFMMFSAQFHRVSAESQALNRWFMVSSSLLQSGHFEGPLKPFFPRFSHVSIFLYISSQRKVLIFGQLWESQTLLLQATLSTCSASSMHNRASLSVKLPPPWFPHLSLSLSSAFLIFLLSNMMFRLLEFIFPSPMFSISLFAQFLHAVSLLSCDQ